MSVKENELLRDTFVKITGIFSEEFYIFPNGYVIDIPSCRLMSMVRYIKLKPKYLNAIREVYFKIKPHAILHIKNSKLIKDDLAGKLSYCFDDMIASLRIIEDKQEIETETNELNNMINIFNDSQWREFRLDKDDEINSELFDNLFSKSKSIEFDPDETGNFIILGKTLFPMVKLNNYKENLFYEITEKNLTTNIIKFKFNFSHFESYTLFTFLKMV